MQDFEESPRTDAVYEVAPVTEAQCSSAAPSLAFATTLVGVAGTKVPVTALLAALGALWPWALVATTLTVVATPLLNPPIVQVVRPAGALQVCAEPCDEVTW